MVHGSFLSLSYWWPLAYLMHLSFYLSSGQSFIILSFIFIFWPLGFCLLGNSSFLNPTFPIFWFILFWAFRKSGDRRRRKFHRSCGLYECVLCLTAALRTQHLASSYIPFSSFTNAGECWWRGQVFGNCLAGLSSFLPFLSCARQEYVSFLLETSSWFSFHTLGS